MRCRVRDRIILVVALAAATTPAFADDTAETLFTEARGLLRDGKTAEACERFAGSLAKFEERGVAKSTAAAMLNLADCREQNQQLATAWAWFLKTATMAQNHGLRPVATEARKRAGLVQPRISYLTIAVADSNRVEGLVITRDGQPIEPAMWNQGVPIDGGSYVVTAVAPGNTEWSAKAEVPIERGAVTIEIPRLKRLDDYVAVISPTPPEPAREEVGGSTGGRWTPLHWGGVGAAGVGVVALGAGVYFGLQARAIDDEAAGWDTFDPDRYADGAAAERRSIIALSVGAGCVVAGGALFYLGQRAGRRAPERVSVTPLMTPGALGLAATGSF